MVEVVRVAQTAQVQMALQERQIAVAVAVAVVVYQAARAVQVGQEL
jgi:hypothetical protein